MRNKKLLNNHGNEGCYTHVQRFVSACISNGFVGITLSRCVLYKPLTQICAVSNTLLRLTFLALVIVFFDMIKLTIISSLPVNTGLLVQYIIDARVYIGIGAFI